MQTKKEPQIDNDGSAERLRKPGKANAWLANHLQPVLKNFQWERSQEQGWTRCLEKFLIEMQLDLSGRNGCPKPMRDMKRPRTTQTAVNLRDG
jgi:hypothetical protein